MLSALGILVTGNQVLTDALRRTLNALAAHQTPLGHIPSLANDPNDRGGSDSTPLFLPGLALVRQSEYEPAFLEEAARKALTWMQYQSPDDMARVSQLPTSDWRDEQWVLGYGPFVRGVYIAACVAAGRMGLARRNLVALAELVKPWHENEAEWGFNEWIKAQSGQPSGRDWQTWSAATYLYAVECVWQERTPFFEEMRNSNRATVKDPGVGVVSR